MKDEMYTRWPIKKRRGGVRWIESPNDDLKARQRESIDKLEEKLQVSPFTHGFARYKNIATMAMSHVGKEYVGSIDIADYFPSISLEKFLDKVKTVPKEELWDHFHDFCDGKGNRLPQGAPGSPLISNAYLFRLDWRMAWQCHERGCDFTRYADDLTISGPNRDDVVVLLKIASELMRVYYGLKTNKKKTKIVHRSRRMLVCGVVVNERLNLKREDRKRLRAIKHQEMLKNGKLSLETKGKVAFEAMIRENTKTTHSSREIIDSVKVTKEMAAVK
jgi:retron-type reverse transcriptase